MSGPSPPADLASRRPQLFRLDRGTILHRFYTRTGGARTFDPIYYDSSLSGRFNAPDGSYGVLYAAKESYGAFAETFLRTSGRRMIDAGLMARKGYASLEVRRGLTLIEFDGRWLAPLGATAAVPHSDPPYDNAQVWSKALRSHPVRPDGIAYTSRHDPSQLCFAVFENSDPPVAVLSRETNLDASWFWDLADHYQAGMAP